MSRRFFVSASVLLVVMLGVWLIPGEHISSDKKVDDAPQLATEQFSKEAIYFKSDDGQYVVYGNRWGQSLYFSPDGKKFFTLLTGSSESKQDEEKISITDPHQDERSGLVHRVGDTLTLWGKSFTKTNPSQKFEVVPLPDVRAAEYLFSFPDGRYVYVSSSKWTHSYESFRLYLGMPDKLEEVKITGMVERYRDGGTTYIPTEKGVLYSPSVVTRNANGEPKWRKEPHQAGEGYPDAIVETWKEAANLKRLNPWAFTIKEEGGVVTLKSSLLEK